MSQYVQTNYARRKRLLVLLYAVAILAALYYFIDVALVDGYRAPGVDFGKHYRAAEMVWDGVNPCAGVNFLGFNYSVFSALFFSWLAWFSFPVAEHLWDFWNGLMVLLSGLVVAIFYRPETCSSEGSPETIRQFLARHWFPLAFFLVIFYPPLTLRMYDGNVEPTGYLLVVLFGAAWLRKHEFLAGMLLAFATLIKIPFGVVLLYCIIIGRYRVLRGFCAIVIPYVALLLVSGWWRWELFLFTEVLPRLGFHYQAISFSLVDFVAEYIYTPAKHDFTLFHRLTLLLNLALMLPFILVVLLLSRRFLRTHPEFGIVFIFLSLPVLSPMLEENHHSWEAIALFFSLVLWLRGEWARAFYLQLPLWLLILGSSFLIDFAFLVRYFNINYAATFGVFCLWIFNGLYLIRRQARSQTALA